MSATIVRGAWVLAMQPGRELVRDGAVAFDGAGEILAVGSYDEVAAAHPGAAVVGDGAGIVAPGWVNGHTHLTECLIPGMGEDASLWEWFERVVNPAGLTITREDVRLGTRVKAVEMLQSGITTVSDMSCHRNLGSLASLGAAEGLADAGLRGVVSFGAENLYDGAPPADVFMAEHEALADLAAGHPLLDFRLGIGTVLGVTEELFARSVRACAEHGWAVHVHLAEVREEITESRVRHGVGTIEHCGRTGLLEHDVLAAHCIWCTDRDIGLLGRTGVSVVHNPVANMILGSGVCPVGRLRGAGIAVALGTDGAASNDSQDYFGVLKSAALLQKVHALDPSVISARDVVTMATIEGARALGLDDRVGSLAPGKRADIILLGGDTPELAAIHDPWQQLVYCATARSVRDVWVDGVRRVAGGEVVGVDVPALVAESRAAATELVRRAGLGAESVLAGEGRLDLTGLVSS